MRETIQQFNEQIVVLNGKLVALRDAITSFQKVCDHDWEDADDLYNHHTRTEYERCSICGKER